MKVVWRVGVGQTSDGEVRLAPEGHTTSSATYCPSRGRGPKTRWVCGDERIVPGEWVAAAVVADPEVGYRWEEVDRSATALVE